MQKLANVHANAGKATTQTSIQRIVSISVGRTTEGFYDTRPQRSGRCKCHGHLTKGSRLEQRARVCPKGLCVKTMLAVILGSFDPVSIVVQLR